MVVVGLALDRIASRPTHTLADPLHPEPPPSRAVGEPYPARRAALIAPSLARACVAAALRSSGLGVDDARIDAMIARARASAWLPETRMRAMRLMTDAAHATTLTTTDGTTYYDAVGANLVLELRLTWRLDRLLFAGDETAFERTRLERENARSRLAERTLEVLFAWRRAGLEADGGAPGSPEELQSRLRESEALATLDVLTSGGSRGSSRVLRDPFHLEIHRQIRRQIRRRKSGRRAIAFPASLGSPHASGLTLLPRVVKRVGPAICGAKRATSSRTSNGASWR